VVESVYPESRVMIRIDDRNYRWWPPYLVQQKQYTTRSSQAL